MMIVAAFRKNRHTGGRRKGKIEKKKRKKKQVCGLGGSCICPDATTWTLTMITRRMTKRTSATFARPSESSCNSMQPDATDRGFSCIGIPKYMPYAAGYVLTDRRSQKKGREQRNIG